ncbi:DNA mismatch repair protein MutL [Amniculicola lignicola CBS 123094]|uniref:DNA mismatch repair protein PMS1 n=1 Tax=Amniculicola lignicola CBS 123094 TaxID=1392246 RepID=A0A6A5VX25_9PLEO|nr:DNA mismatch repair protein MutL [Amniculicola lignicola CBS 123094]
MATIKAIESRSVHQIQSGQVIVDLCSVAKELVENGLDAGATSIEVRFKNHGLDSIEVQDNGSGISPADYDTIGLKHYTSKLSTYDDLSSLQTFGFRGEALSSLCALSKFHIVTARAADGAKGTRLDFEVSGKLRGTAVMAAKQGTTVVVDSLFYNLPVRRKELEKTIAREYKKVLHLLHAYACISVGVKFTVSNRIPKGKKTTAFATNSNPNTKENIANVYGAKTLLSLIPLDLKFDMDPSNRPGATQSARNWSTQDDTGAREVCIVGHISRPVVGEGRQTPDRQMFFVNSRPCALPQVSKAFSDVYKSYNITQSAFIFADLKLDTNAYDVNVSPDKRTIMLHDQTALLESLKNALVELFEGHDQSVPHAQLLGKKLPSFRPPVTQQRESTELVDEERTILAGASDRVVEREDDSPTSPASVEEPRQPGFIKASLIERFAGRDTEERTLHHPPKPKRTLSHEKRDAPQRPEPVTEETVDEEPLFVPERSESPPLPRSPAITRTVQEFNAQIASQHAKLLAKDQLSRSQVSDESEEEEERILAIRTPQKRSTQSTIQNAFDRMRPMRTPIRQAIITVGDTTTVSTIGSETRASKRARIHTPKFSLSGRPLSQTPKRPSIMKSLLGFAAPGTQMDVGDEEDEEEQEDAAPESSMPEVSAADSPSLNNRKGTTVSSTDDVFEDSSELPMPPPVPAGDEEENDEEAPPQVEESGSDTEYIDEAEKKLREEARIARLIAEAEEAAARPTDFNLKRANRLLQASKRKHHTFGLTKFIETSVTNIAHHMRSIDDACLELDSTADDLVHTNVPSNTQLNTSNPEERLSLTVTKSDFHAMRIIGQFNLGFILAVRPPSPLSPTPDLFIIDQHASDEKYNFERLSATTVLESQRLVHPHGLELTAVEEEVILGNEYSLTANGFVVELLPAEEQATAGYRAKLTSLPTSKGVTFTPTDLEELLALLIDNPPSSSLDSVKYIPRPSKVRKLLASRACRSSVMVGKTMTGKQMEKVIRHMGEMDKPWSCPHGRPTMRHLFGLDGWSGWSEGDGVMGIDDERDGRTDWGAYLRTSRGGGGGGGGSDMEE